MKYGVDIPYILHENAAMSLSCTQCKRKVKHHDSSRQVVGDGPQTVVWGSAGEREIFTWNYDPHA